MQQLCINALRITAVKGQWWKRCEEEFQLARLRGFEPSAAGGVLAYSAFRIPHSALESGGDTADAPELLRAGEIKVLAHKTGRTHRIDLADDMNARVVWINADQHVPEVSPDKIIRAAYE